MDCSVCNNLLLDLVYDDLDEVRAAASRRHIESCASCRTAYERLARGRSLAQRYTLEEPPPPDDALMAAMRASIERSSAPAVTLLPTTDAALDGSVVEPHPLRIPRWLRRAGEVAMRREVAMAAVSLLIVGVSLRFVQVQSPGRADDQDLSPSAEVIPAREVTRQPTVAPAPVSTTSHLRSLITGAPFRQGFADHRAVAGAHASPGPAPASPALAGDLRDHGSAEVSVRDLTNQRPQDNGGHAQPMAAMQQARAAEEPQVLPRHDVANVAPGNRDLLNVGPSPVQGSPFANSSQAQALAQGAGIESNAALSWQSELRRANQLRAMHPEQAIAAYNHALDLAPDTASRRMVAVEFCPFLGNPNNASHRSEMDRVCGINHPTNDDTTNLGNLAVPTSMQQNMNTVPHHAASRPPQPAASRPARSDSLDSQMGL